MKKDNIINIAVGAVVLFGTVYLISKAWKLGQKDKKSNKVIVPTVSVVESVDNDYQNVYLGWLK